MEQKNWDKFIETGRVVDYLSYKLDRGALSCRLNEEECVGVWDCESDCIDRNGAVCSTRWGI